MVNQRGAVTTQLVKIGMILSLDSIPKCQGGRMGGEKGFG